RVALVVDEDGRILVEPDVAPVRAPDLLGRAHDDRTHDVALLDRGVGDRGLDARDDHVADAGRGLARAAHHADALDRPRAGVVGDAQARLGLDHAWPPSSSAPSFAPASAVAASAE